MDVEEKKSEHLNLNPAFAKLCPKPANAAMEAVFCHRSPDLQWSRLNILGALLETGSGASTVTLQVSCPGFLIHHYISLRILLG